MSVVSLGTMERTDTTWTESRLNNCDSDHTHVPSTRDKFFWVALIMTAE
jgi:hypothetical protein